MFLSNKAVVMPREDKLVMWWWIAVKAPDRPHQPSDPKFTA
jgi:hypothetical protein